MSQKWSDAPREAQVFFICLGVAMGCLLISLFVDKWANALGWFGFGLTIGGFISLWWRRF